MSATCSHIKVYKSGIHEKLHDALSYLRGVVRPRFEIRPHRRYLLHVYKNSIGLSACVCLSVNIVGCGLTV
jgi:hypothetical protein